MSEQHEQLRIKQSIKALLKANKEKTGVPMSTFAEQAILEKLEKTNKK